MTNRTLQKNLFQTATFLLGFSVIAGAFGAHQLKTVLTPNELETFNTGLQYQFIHSAALLMLSIGLRRCKEKTVRIAATLFGIGMVIFCGSLYLLAIRNSIGLGEGIKWIGAFTPIGGLCFIAGWFYLSYNGYKPYDGNYSEHEKPLKTQHADG